jgi:hypothetical protein
MKLRRATLRLLGAPVTRSPDLRMDTTSAWRRQPRPRNKNGAACLTELPCQANKVWLQAHSRQTAATSMSMISRPEQQ